MRVLLTGAAGFLGSHLCERFLDEGHEVIGVDNFVTGRLGNVEALRGRPGFQFLEHDVTQPFEVSGDLSAVLHFASPASPEDYQAMPIHTLLVGSQGTHNTLELALEKRARYLLASTSEVYGDPQTSPQSEEYWGNVNTLGPRGPYDEAKRFAETMTMAYHNVHSLSIQIARIFNTYGPRMRRLDGRVVSTFIRQALNDEPLTVYGEGRQTRSFCYVEDEVEGLYRLLKSDHLGAINIGSPHEMTIRELAENIIVLTRSSSRVIHRPLPEDDPQIRRPDISLARRVLGWEPQVSLNEGLARTIDYFKNSNHRRR